MNTMKEYIDEVKLRLSRINVSLELENQVIESIINRERRDVQHDTIGLFPERYGKRKTIPIPNTPDGLLTITNPQSQTPVNVYRVPLPLDLIDIFVVIVRFTLNGTITEYGMTYDNVTFENEAREVTKQELYSIQKQSYNAPKVSAPIYAKEIKIFDVGATVTPNPVLYIAGLDVNLTTTLFDIADDIVVEVWYTAGLVDLEETPADVPGALPDREVTIPADAEELVIYKSMVRCLQKQAAEKQLVSVSQEIDILLEMVAENYSVAHMKAGALLPSRENLST